MHCLGFLGDDLPDGRVSESDGGRVRFGAVNASFVGHKVHASAEDVRRLMTPFGVNRRVKALDMAPPGLTIIRLVGLVTKGDAGDVFGSKKSFKGLGDCGLGFTLGEITSN